MLPKNLLIPIIGVIFIGVILTLGNMNIIPEEIVAFWPVILIVGGLVGLTSMDMPSSITKKTPKATTSVKKATKSTKKKTRK